MISNTPNFKFTSYTHNFNFTLDNMVTSLSMLEEFTCNNNVAASRDIKSFLPLKVKGTLSRREIAGYDEIHGDFMQLAVFPELCNVKLEDMRNVFRDVFKINCER